MTVRQLPQAQLDVFDAASWYEQQKVGLAQDFLTEFGNIVRRIAMQPRLYSRVSRSPRGREIRQALVARFPFLVIYELTAIEVIVVAVTHVRSSRRTWRRRI